MSLSVVVESGVAAGPGGREVAIAEVEAELAVLCGVVNAAEARITDLVGRGIEEELWGQGGVMSAEHWAGWQCGLSPARARQFTAAARRADELPETMGLFRRGLLSADQVATIVRYVPAVKDSEVAGFAELATVSQLRRALARYDWGPDRPEKPRVEQRRCSFGFDEDGTWSLQARAPADEGARIEAGLNAMRKELLNDAPDAESRQAVTWLDALLGLVDRTAENDDAKVLGRRKRHMVHLHLEIGVDGEWTGHLHLGPLISSTLLRYQACDCSIQPILHQLGLPISVGRTSYAVPHRTRLAVEDRDRGCRVPGCNQRRVEVHHIVHWLDGGATDTWNLVCLCARHHQLHHLDTLGISGNADDPDGIVFTDRWGRIIRGVGGVDPPARPPGRAADQAQLPWQPYRHASGEPYETRNTWFGPPVTTT